MINPPGPSCWDESDLDRALIPLAQRVLDLKQQLLQSERELRMACRAAAVPMAEVFDHAYR